MSGSLSGSQVLRRIQENGDSAIAELFDQHRDRLLRMVGFRMDARLRGRVGPEDIVQEAYLDAVQRIDHFTANPVTSIFVWFRMITIQALHNAHRRHLGTHKRDAAREVSSSKRGYGSGETAASITGLLIGQLTSPSQAAIREERSKQLQDALETVSELDQEVLALRHFEELTNQETAEVLGIEPRTASVRYFRALRRLRGVLEKLPAFE